MPAEPPATPWVFPNSESATQDLIAVGADLEPGTLLAAYRSGLFPMPLMRNSAIGWFSPQDRAVLPLEGLRVTRSMRQSARRYDVTVDRAFAAIVKGCAHPARQGAWIDRQMTEAYGRLNTLDWAHSIEVWTRDGRLGGGMYGVAIGGLFCGESMFYRARDASKVALMALVDLLADGEPDRVLDVQWSTPHLGSLGVVEIGRVAYLERLEAALATPLPAIWRG